MSGVEVAGIGLFCALALAVTARRGLQAVGDAAEQIGLGACGGESDAHSSGGLRDAGGDLEQPRTQRGELGQCKRLGFGMVSRSTSINQ